MNRAAPATNVLGMILPGLLVLGLCLGGNAHGAEPDDASGSWFSWFHHPQCPCCPDDYCPKKCPPCPPWVTSHAPDDYCPKKLPCVTGTKCFGKDDYCSKSCAIYLPACPPFWYSCVPEGCCGAKGTCRTLLEPPQP